jgi:hypothetical protein
MRPSRHEQNKALTVRTSLGTPVLLNKWFNPRLSIRRNLERKSVRGEFVPEEDFLRGVEP